MGEVAQEFFLRGDFLPDLGQVGRLAPRPTLRTTPSAPGRSFASKSSGDWNSNGWGRESTLISIWIRGTSAGSTRPKTMGII